MSPNSEHDVSHTAPVQDVSHKNVLGAETQNETGTSRVDATDHEEQLSEAMGNISVDSDRSAIPHDGKDLPAPPPPPALPAKSGRLYIDSTPKTPSISRRPSDQGTDLKVGEEVTGRDSIAGNASVGAKSGDDNESSTEIQSIMDQFADETSAPTKEEIMSPRHEAANPFFAPQDYPPRKSSLEPLRSRDMDTIASPPAATASEKTPSSPPPPPVPPKPEASGVLGSPTPSIRNMSICNVSTSSLSAQLPSPEPEPELPFDFHRFLEQLRHKSADPVAKFLRSFLSEFGKKQWMVHEQVKIISDFLTFITNKMSHCEVWREVSDNEFENAKEGMEKLVMNRLYSQTFSPAIPSLPAPPGGRGKRKELDKVLGVGRRGQHQEDVERDDILAQKIRIYSWIREQHLDIPPVGANGERFLRLAQQELVKIKNYRAPRDKVICILNCCKVIFGLLKNSKSSDTSADSFVPLLIFVVLQANPEHLVSNIQYILRFRNQDKLVGEAGYYLSSLSGAVQFVESLDRTTLTVSDEEFERSVEQAVSAIAEQNRQGEATSPREQHYSEKSALPSDETTPRRSLDSTTLAPRKSFSRSGTSSVADAADEAMGGLLKTIQKPLSSIGRMFSDVDESSNNTSSGSTSQPRPAPVRFPPSDDRGNSSLHGTSPERRQVLSYDAQEAAARQASAESAEARRIQRAEHRTVVDTLCGMFPNLDREVIDDVVRQKQGRVGLAVDACLALTAGG